jgi:hypothetical protein
MFRNRLLAVVGVFALVSVTAIAEDKKKEVKLEGELVCGKCKLKESKECTNVLQVKEGDKTVNYYLDDKGTKEDYHKMCCTKTTKVTLTGGEIVEKDSKKMIKGTFKVEEAKEKKEEPKKEESKKDK